MTKLDCIITAGGLPQPDDPMYAITNGKSKALIDMGGRTMLERVVDALQGAACVDEIFVVGLGGDMGMQFARPVHHVPDAGGMVANLLAGIAARQATGKPHGLFILCTADVPLIDSRMIDEFVERCQPLDHVIYYNFATQAVMEQRFPASNRTFVKLKGLNVAGGDVMLAHSGLGESHRGLWESLSNARKHAWRLARIVGLPFLLKFAFRRVNISDIQAAATRILERPVKLQLTPHAEMAMDADKPNQVKLLQREFGVRTKG